MVLKETMKKLFSIDGEYGLKKALFNIVAVGGTVAGSLAIMVSALIELPVIQLIAIAMSIVILLICLYIANKLGKVNAGAILMLFAVTIILFPVMFYTDGGIYGGMGYWFVLGILFNFLILEGRSCLIILILQIAATLICFIDSYLHPEHIIALETTLAVYIDTVQSVLITAVVIGIIVRFQNKAYKDKMRELEEAQQQAIQAAEDARAAERVKTEFLAQMSHEIRTPINAVLGMDEMILRESDEKNTLEYAGNIRLAGKNLLSIINDILDFSKIESGRLEIVPVEYDPAVILMNLFSSFNVRSHEKGLELVFEADETLPCLIYGDDVRLTQILTNLLSNAVKYTEKGKVSLKVSDKGHNNGISRIEFCVEDTGIGIKEEDLDKLMLPFQRLETKRNRNIEGTGLGMAIVMNLLRLLGSDLEVESVYGKGSRFRFILEQRIISDEPIGDFRSRAESYNTLTEEEECIYAPDARILVVDDNNMNLMVMTGLLKRNGIVPVLAGSGAECLDILKRSEFDIVFLDMMMPQMDGTETLNRIKEENLIKNGAKVIALTADAVMGARERYLAAGFDDYLSKPLEIGDLETMLRKHLSDYNKKENSEDHDKHGSSDIGKRYPSLDIAAGLKYCMNSEEFLEEMIAEYIKSDLREKLASAYGSQNWKDYRVYAHSLKNSSLNIGAADLSEQAKNLEFAARDENSGYILSHHDEVMSGYTALLNELSGCDQL